MPIDHQPRRLVVCADGTWNTQDAEGFRGPPPTNVVKLARAVRPIAADGTSQVVYYHEGVGNAFGLARTLGGAFGYGLSRNLRDCYRFLVDNYHPGDELYLFGFSRGAYTVRSLAGLIRNCGILRSEYADLIPEAFERYRTRDKERHPNSLDMLRFREQNAHEVRIRCLGVWDSVGALGVPTSGPLGWWSRRKYGFHDVMLSGHVEHAYHALAIDERRKPFQPTLWEVNTPGQDVEQVWFAGVHSNVGGGYRDCGLSDEACRWMMEKAAALGLAFDEEYVARAIRGGCEDGELYDSMSLFYRCFGNGMRTIGRPERVDERGRTVSTNESVHLSVGRRLRRCVPPGSYAPNNLHPFVPAPASAPGPRSLAETPLLPFPVLARPADRLRTPAPPPDVDRAANPLPRDTALPPVPPA